MRRVFAALFLLFFACPAFSEQKTAPEPKSDYMKPFTAPDYPPEARQFDWPGKPKGFRLHMLPNGGLCYTMHSLVLAREPGSDTTRLVRQRTCTPASQFEMKNTVQQPK